ncbi:LLM class F420-dependent oxidoreductase [Pseudonocardiaceae bacterium YIM PH 21723]|nr:LLM class F420-dependent oxidoreductase [Pseudonocardiaceae bacterium YIM PH 21723]
MKISTTAPLGMDPLALADQVVALEKAGLDTVWVPEAYGFDSPTLMGFIAARTNTVEVGAAILNIYSRTPTLIAGTAAGLDYVSGGRAILGVGASGPQVIEGWHGVPYDKPLGRTREVVDICRRAWKREIITNDGSFKIPLPEGQGTGLGKPLKMLNHPVRNNIPIYVAAIGDKNVQLTAEIGDGWLPILFYPEKAREVWGSSLDNGGAKRSGDLGTLEIVAGGILGIGDDLDHLLDASAAMSSLYIGGMGARGKNFYNTLFQRYGYEEQAKVIQDLYLDGKKEEAAAAVPREFLKAINLVGPEGYIKERLAAFREAGVTNLSVNPLVADPVAEIRKLKELIG